MKNDRASRSVNGDSSPGITPHHDRGVSMEKKWFCIEVEAGGELADDLAAEVAYAFNVGVEITGKGIRFYLRGDSTPDRWEEKLRDILEDAGKTWRLGEPLHYDWSRIPEDNWAERWKVHFKPLRVGRRFLIVPTWEQANPDPEDLVIRMDPGRAFGTGHHETTRLCLRWLEEWAASWADSRSRSLLDVGTGSGILALAAALLGVDRVTGVDNDPEAVEVARENIELNALSERVCAVEGSAGDVRGTFDVVIANIQAHPLVEMAASLSDKAAAGGRLVLGGVLTEQRESVQSAYERAGRRFLEMKTEGEWCLLVFG